MRRRGLAKVLPDIYHYAINRVLLVVDIRVVTNFEGLSVVFYLAGDVYFSFTDHLVVH